MRVAITHTRYTSSGGVERYAWDLVKRLLDAGHEVHFFCHFWDDQTDPRVKLHKIPNRWKQIRFMKVWSYDRWVTRNVRREDFDVVHGFSKSSLQDIYTDGSGCLLDYQAYSIDERKTSDLAKALRRASLHQRQVLAIEERRFTRGNFSKVVAMSDLAAEQIRSRYGLTRDEVVTIYNGIDVARFHPDNRAKYQKDYRERIRVFPDTFLVLCVGNDFKRKGVPALIEAARILAQRGLPGGRTFRVAVFGREKLKVETDFTKTLRQYGIYDRVKFMGPTDLVERWMATADLFVLPSRFDAFGNVVLEAMASGTPALVSSKAGAAEVVRDGVDSFVLKDPDDAQAIADCVTKLCDEDLRQRIGQAARATAEAYSWDAHFTKMLALYEEVAAAKRSKAAAKA